MQYLFRCENVHFNVPETGVKCCKYWLRDQYKWQKKIQNLRNDYLQFTNQIVSINYLATLFFSVNLVTLWMSALHREMVDNKIINILTNYSKIKAMVAIANSCRKHEALFRPSKLQLCIQKNPSMNIWIIFNISTPIKW